jgi:16S rRNA (adenine1518-N6/adenine1519-N6)-dimethyltransferase
MMQYEVANRIVAGPRTKAYGILSVLLQMFADVRNLFAVSPQAFSPKPKVRSMVLHMVPLARPRYLVENEEFFRQMVRGVFGKRRKTLRNSLRYFLGEDAGDLAGLPFLEKRPEELTVSQLVEMSNIIYQRWRPIGTKS